jgi:uncharacterized membrane protein YfcA
MFAVLTFAAAVLAGAVAAVSGFGIGSLLTPLLAARLETRLAVALVAVPHVAATAVRFHRLRSHLNRRVFLNFGLLSAGGGLLGALLSARAASPALDAVFGCLLVLAGGSAWTGLWQRLRFGRTTAWVAGGVSGFFGGLVGNQGGIRSAALLGFPLQRDELVATATAVALLVDAARLPVYVAGEHAAMGSQWLLLAVATAGCLAGTFWGVSWLRRIPEPQYRRWLGAILTLLGVYFLWKA